MCLIGFSSKRFIDDLNFRAAQELFYFPDTYNKVIVLESIQMLIIVDWAFNGGTQGSSPCTEARRAPAHIHPIRRLDPFSFSFLRPDHVLVTGACRFNSVRVSSSARASLCRSRLFNRVLSISAKRRVIPLNSV